MGPALSPYRAEEAVINESGKYCAVLAVTKMGWRRRYIHLHAGQVAGGELVSGESAYAIKGRSANGTLRHAWSSSPSTPRLAKLVCRRGRRGRSGPKLINVL